MRERWLSIGCFLIGYNYRIVKACSELSVKRVLRYTSAFLIVCLLWGVVGFIFTRRYMQGEWYTSLVVAIIMIFLVVQIERQIILSTRDNKMLHIFRSVIGFSMALIGTVIIDQVIFKDDIERKKITILGEEVKAIFPVRSVELKRQIDEIDSTILNKENERTAITDDLAKNPFVVAYEVQVKSDTSKNPIRTTTRKQIPNPKANLLGSLDKNISDLRVQKIKKDSMLLSLRTVIEADLNGHIGFLDELEVMYSLLSESLLSLCAWGIWFIFLIGLELLILVSKWGETETDYDRMMSQQMELHFRRIDLLKNQSPS